LQLGRSPNPNPLVGPFHRRTRDRYSLIRDRGWFSVRQVAWSDLPTECGERRCVYVTNHRELVMSQQTFGAPDRELSINSNIVSSNILRGSPRVDSISTGFRIASQVVDPDVGAGGAAGARAATSRRALIIASRVRFSKRLEINLKNSE